MLPFFSCVLLILGLCFLLARLVCSCSQTGTQRRHLIPPGPPPLPLLGNLLLLSKPFPHLTHLLRRLKAAYGPVVTLHVGRRPAIFIMDAAFARDSLVHKGEAFAHRPPPLGTSRALASNLHTVNMADYGPLWRRLRLALSSHVFHPSQLGPQGAAARAWAFHALARDLRSQAESGGGIVMPTGILHFALSRLFALFCFGVQLEDETLRSVREAQLAIINIAVKLSVFNLLPKFALSVFLGRWMQLLRARRRLDGITLPVIRNWKPKLNQPSYVDALLELDLAEEEIVSLCTEFLNASTETTSTALEWIMANLVKDQSIQEKLAAEIESVTGGASKTAMVEDEEMRRMPYLKAVVMEGLRRHPPAHLLLPHTVEEDTEVRGFVVPRGAVVNVAVAEIGRDEAVWREAMEFRPERFLTGGEGEGVNLAGVGGEIKMMPFGAGRRICPGMGVAVTLLQYFVGNLVGMFRWEQVEGEDHVDLTEEPGLVVGLKFPFRARLVAR